MNMRQYGMLSVCEGKVALLAAVGVILIAVIGLAGWMTGHTVLASIRESFIPMAPSTVACFLVLALALLGTPAAGSRLMVRHTIRAFVILVMILGACKAITFFRIDLDFEDLVFPRSDSLHGIPLGRMSPWTGALFFVSALSLLLGPLASPSTQRGPNQVHLSGLLAFATIFGAFATLLSYLYGTPILYESTVVPMAATTAAGFLLLGVGITSALPPGTIPLNFLLQGSATSAQLARSFVPLVVLAVIVQGFISRIGPSLWHVNDALLSAFLAVIVAILFGVMAIYSGSKVGKLIDDTESELRRSEERFRLAMEAAEGGLWDWHVQTGQVISNERYADMLGVSADEPSNHINLWKEMVHPDDLPGVLEKTTRLLQGRIPQYEVEYRLQDRSGNWKWIHARGMVVERDDAGQALRIAGIVLDVTDRKHAEEKLQHAERRYRSLFEHAPFMYVLTWNQGGTPIIRDCNELFLRSLGYARGEVLGKSLADFYSAESVVQLREGGYAKSLAGGVLIGERELRKKDGSLVPTLLYTAAEADPSGQVIGTRAMYADITELKEMESAKQESEGRYRAVFENAAVGIDVMDADGRIIQVNRSLALMLGYREDELLNRTFLDITHPEDVEASKNRYQQMMRGEVDSYRIEKRYIRKDGRVIWVDVSVSPVRTSGGAHVAVIAVITDITRRKEAEAARERLVSAIEQAAEAAIITDVAGDIQYVNPAFEKITGYTREEAVGRNPRILKSGEHDREFYREMWNTIKGGEVWSGRLVNRRKDGRLYHEEATISPLKDPSGRIVNFVSMKRDITENLELSKQLVQAQKMEAVGTLAGGVAHDFNNILQVALGYSEMVLADEDLPQSIKADVQKIYESAMRGADLVQRLLAFSKKMEIKPRPLNLNRRIDEIQKMLARTLPKMISIELILAEDLAAINADPTQMDQILMNLSVNARDSMPEGGKLTIETANVILDEEYARTHLNAKPGPYVLLMVTDTGVGMDRATLEHIFEPFFTTKETGKGTGLGLSMVHGIVQQHGGHIRCYSEPGQGTTFRIHFPALVSQEQLPEATVRTMPRGGSETILLVDDDEVVRDFGARILTKAGYTVLTASNGREALGVYQARQDKTDLVILDLIMPEMGGKQCMEALLNLDPSVKVVIASGYSGDGHTKESLAAGAKGVVGKPYDIRRVLEVVRQSLDAE